MTFREDAINRCKDVIETADNTKAAGFIDWLYETAPAASTDPAADLATIQLLWRQDFYLTGVPKVMSDFVLALMLVRHLANQCQVRVHEASHYFDFLARYTDFIKKA
ncbi:hypothetical protein D3C87_768470 [compost metagenome]